MNIKKLYIKLGFPSKSKIKNHIKHFNLKIDDDDINKFYNDLEIEQKYKRFVKPKEFNSINAKFKSHIYQLDILVLFDLEYRGYKYILNCIDVYSRYSYGVALKNRFESTIIAGIKIIFQKLGIPKNINLDNEFNTNNIKFLLRSYNIKPYFSFADEAFINTKNAIVERFNGTLRNRIKKHIVNYQKNNWIEDLSKIYDGYNKSYHSTIKKTPFSVFKQGEIPMNEINYIPLKFKIGDKVRLLIHYNEFKKGDKQNYSDDIYTIIKKSKKYYNRWVLSDENGNILERPYMERDFLLIDNDSNKLFENRPDTRLKKLDKLIGEKVKQRRNKQLALKNLEPDRGFIVEKITGKRNRNPKKLLDL